MENKEIEDKIAADELQSSECNQNAIEIEIPTISAKRGEDLKDGKALDEIDTIELAISEIVNQMENQKKGFDRNFTSTSSKEKNNDINLIEVIETTHEEETEEENKARVALQQLESINSSSRRRKKNEIGSVVCTKKLQTTTLDNNDLIAILQGTDDILSENGTTSVKEEVLIEGEGHFEVLDIVETEDSDKQKSAESSNTSLFLKNRKRKQEYKSDLVSSIASEWSDDDDGETSKSTSAVEKAVIKSEELDTKIPEITPFKRTRVIKRKIIWDPDAPETQFSYASLIQPKNKISLNQAKEQNKKRLSSPVRRKFISPVEKKQENIDKKPKTAVSNTITKKKKMTEIDRLLGDEGAANMLNSLEQQAEHTTVFENKNKRSASTKSKPSENWDYVYNSTSVDSMIARRRSTSSYSSTSPHRNSFDATPPNSVRTKNGKNNDNKKKATKHFEFARPEAKKTSKKDYDDDDAVKNKNYDMVSEIKKSVEKKKNSEIPKQKETGNKMKKEIDDVVVKKIGGVYHILVDTKSSKSKNMFTLKMLNKITDIFTDLSDEDECKVILFSSSGQNFCQGLDFTDLVNLTDKRNKSCQDWAKSISELFQAMIKFPKPLLTAVQGNVSGLGVMLIPLFDITICSEKSVFETSYIKSGQFPEGYCLLNAISDRNLVKRMVWLGEKISSSEAVSHGFITKSTQPQKTFEETLSYAKQISTYSQDVYTNMKKLRFTNLGTNKILDQLKEDEITLSKSLISDTFCENYKHFISKGSW
ncbi:hypothetical protein ACFFRR_009777 [Megaselia abdita]